MMKILVGRALPAVSSHLMVRETHPTTNFSDSVKAAENVGEAGKPVSNNFSPSGGKIKPLVEAELFRSDP